MWEIASAREGSVELEILLIANYEPFGVVVSGISGHTVIWLRKWVEPDEICSEQTRPVKGRSRRTDKTATADDSS